MNLISTSEAAHIIGVSRRRVQQLIAEGRIEAQRVGAVLVVSRQSAEEFVRQPSGRPKREH